MWTVVAGSLVMLACVELPRLDLQEVTSQRWGACTVRDLLCSCTRVLPTWHLRRSTMYLSYTYTQSAAHCIEYASQTPFHRYVRVDPAQSVWPSVTHVAMAKATTRDAFDFCPCAVLACGQGCWREASVSLRYRIG